MHKKFTLRKGVQSFTAIDFETANYQRNSACQLGIAVVEAGEIVHSQAWLIKPPTPLFVFTYLHGIDYAMVKQQPVFPAVWQQVRTYIENRIVAAHNATFDVSVLVAALKHYGLPVPEFQVLDSLTIARKTWPELPNHKLDTVARKIRCNLQHHEAQSDAIACAQIILQAEREKN